MRHTLQSWNFGGSSIQHVAAALSLTETSEVAPERRIDEAAEIIRWETAVWLSDTNSFWRVFGATHVARFCFWHMNPLQFQEQVQITQQHLLIKQTTQHGSSTSLFASLEWSHGIDSYSASSVRKKITEPTTKSLLAAASASFILPSPLSFPHLYANSPAVTRQLSGILLAVSLTLSCAIQHLWTIKPRKIHPLNLWEFLQVCPAPKILHPNHLGLAAT